MYFTSTRNTGRSEDSELLLLNTTLSPSCGLGGLVSTVVTRNLGNAIDTVSVAVLICAQNRGCRLMVSKWSTGL